MDKFDYFAPHLMDGDLCNYPVALWADQQKYVMDKNEFGEGHFRSTYVINGNKSTYVISGKKRYWFDTDLVKRYLHQEHWTIQATLVKLWWLAHWESYSYSMIRDVFGMSIQICGSVLVYWISFPRNGCGNFTSYCKKAKKWLFIEISLTNQQNIV